MADAVPAGDAPGLLGSVTALLGDRSGVETFARYLWQAKQVTRQWLTCLAHDGPMFVLCEHIDDAVLVHGDRIVFQQYKTRDKGSWSAVGMCASGLDASVRSYAIARQADLARVSRFELWLQGPPSPDTVTTAFLHSPRDARVAVRSRLLALGSEHEVLKRAGEAWLDDFLARLTIRAHQPNHVDIDARALMEIGSIWGASTAADVRIMYQRLLDSVTAAQGAQHDVQGGGSVAHVWSARHDQGGGGQQGPAGLGSLRSQVLTRAMLEELTPPLPGTPREKLLGYIRSGRSSSMLELKMLMAGADPRMIETTQAMRAEAEVQRQLLLASRSDAADELEELSVRVLRVADATAQSITLAGAGSPGPARRPAQAIAAELIRNPGQLAAVDRRALFGDGHLLYGLLAHLSDQCRFWWGCA